MEVVSDQQTPPHWRSDCAPCNRHYCLGNCLTHAFWIKRPDWAYLGTP